MDNHPPPGNSTPDQPASGFSEQLKAHCALCCRSYGLLENLEFKFRIIAALAVTFLGQVIIFGAPLLLERVVNRVAQHDAGARHHCSGFRPRHRLW